MSIYAISLVVGVISMLLLLPAPTASTGDFAIFAYVCVPDDTDGLVEIGDPVNTTTGITGAISDDNELCIRRSMDTSTDCETRRTAMLAEIDAQFGDLATCERVTEFTDLLLRCVVSVPSGQGRGQSVDINDGLAQLCIVIHANS